MDQSDFFKNNFQNSNYFQASVFSNENFSFGRFAENDNLNLIKETSVINNEDEKSEYELNSVQIKANGVQSNVLTEEGGKSSVFFYTYENTDTKNVYFLWQNKGPGAASVTFEAELENLKFEDSSETKQEFNLDEGDQQIRKLVPLNIEEATHLSFINVAH